MASVQCSAEGCDRPHLAKGLCRSHYYKANRNKYDRKLAECSSCGAEYSRARRARTDMCPPCATASIAGKVSARAALRPKPPKPAVFLECRSCAQCQLPFWGNRLGTRRYCTKLCAREAHAVANGTRNRACRACGQPLGRVSVKTICVECRTASIAAHRRSSPEGEWGFAALADMGEDTAPIARRTPLQVSISCRRSAWVPVVP